MKETHKNTNLGIALGLCFGVTFGLAIGASFGAEKDKKVNAQIEEQGYIIVAMKKTSPNTYTIRLTNKHGEELQLERHTADIDSSSLRVGKVVYLNDDGHIALAYDDK